MPAGKLLVKNRKKINFFASWKSLKKSVGSGVASGSGSISQVRIKGSGSAPKCHGSGIPNTAVDDVQCWLTLLPFPTRLRAWQQRVKTLAQSRATPCAWWTPCSPSWTASGTVFRIRWIRIQVFFGLLDPDPRAFWPPGSGSGSPSQEVWIRNRLWIRIRIFLSSCKNNKKNLESYYFVTLFDFLSLKNNVNVHSKSNKQKNCVSFLLASWRSMTKIAGSGSRVRIH